MQQPEVPEELLKPTLSPFTGTFVVWDTSHAHTFNENEINDLLSIGFEPYAISMEPDPRQDVQAKAALAGGNRMMVMCQKMWLKRPRTIQPASDSPEIKPA